MTDTLLIMLIGAVTLCSLNLILLAMLVYRLSRKLSEWRTDPQQLLLSTDEKLTEQQLRDMQKKWLDLMSHEVPISTAGAP